MSIQLFIVRHGETTFNSVGKIQGQSDSPLTPLGLRQAEHIAERLAEAGSFNAVYSSDLSRASITADAIARRLCLTVNLTQLLRERSFGVLQGLNQAEIDARYPCEQYEWRRDPANMAPPGGENRQQVINRCAEFIQQILSSHNDGDKIIAVGHGGSVRGLLISGLGLPSDFFAKVQVSNASLTILEVGNKPRLFAF